jgi:hypothetical protein
LSVRSARSLLPPRVFMATLSTMAMSGRSPEIAARAICRSSSAKGNVRRSIFTSGTPDSMSLIRRFIPGWKLSRVK